jgi:hypothetical protein
VHRKVYLKIVKLAPWRFFTVSLLSIILNLVVLNQGHTQVTTDFTGDFDPANWFVDPGLGDGTASLDQFTASFQTANDGLGFDIGGIGIGIPSNGILQFDYLGSTTDTRGWVDGCGCPFEFVGYSINGFPTEFNPSVGPDFNDVSGTANIPVLAGDFFVFEAGTDDALNGPATFNISNFSFTAVPSPKNMPSPSRQDWWRSRCGAAAAETQKLQAPDRPRWCADHGA